MVAFASSVMLLSPAAAAVASVAVKRWGSTIHPLSLTAVPMGMTAVIMGAVSFAVERDATFVFNRASIGALLYLAVLGSAVTFSLYFWLLARMPATRVSIIAFLIPLVAVGVGAAAFDEALTLHTLAGSALVVIGVALTVRGGGDRRRA